LHLHISIDGASRGNPGPAAAAVIIKDCNKKVILSRSLFLGILTNNHAEYFSLLFALAEAARVGGKHLSIRTDSELLARHLNGSYRLRNPNLKALARRILQLKKKFDKVDIIFAPRGHNREADALANQELDEFSRFERAG